MPLELPAELICLVDVQERTNSTSPTGGVISEWSDLTPSLSCNVQQLRAGVAEQYKRFGYTATHRFFFTTDPGVTTKQHRFKFNGEIYEIRRINNIAQMYLFWEIDAEYMGVEVVPE